MIDAKDREIRAGEIRMYLGEDNILYVDTEGDIDEKTAIALKEADRKLKNMAEGEYDVLADLNKAGKHTPEARTIWKEMMEDEKTGKIAMFGLHPVARVLSSFIMGVTKKKDMRFFKRKEQAIEWLKE